jgi:heterodisulfide reductase subunit C/nitrate reductase gamma subunit
MLLTYCAYMAVAVCLAGIVYRISRWLTLGVGPEAEAASIGDRLRGAGKALTGVLRHPRYLWRLIRAFLLDIVLQRHLLKQSAWRWGVHIALFYGMVLLLVVHTFPGLITARLFPEYTSTLNPFMFFRNFLGILVMAGVFSALWRRWRNPVLRCTIQRTDIWLLILLGGIILSGAALEAAQIISPTLFDQMVMDYMGSEDPEAVVPLKAYWAAEFDVAFGPHPFANDPALVEKGLALHLDYCANCHSKPSSAVLAYPLARVIKPFSALLDRIDAVTLLWYGHFLISCLALTLLPFSKLFHLLSTPLSLLIRAMGPVASSRRDNRPARRALGLDACTHCGVCSQHCAVAPIFSIIPNADILPSEKLRGVARMASGRNQPIYQAALAEGSFICTDCGRCTFWCPSGIDLRDLWHASKADLVRYGFPDPHGWITRHSASQWAQILKNKPDVVVAQHPLRQPLVRLADNPDTFRACVQCSICTNVCPVVAISRNHQKDLEMTPQQVMNLMRLQLKESAMGSRMVWDCVTCYKCQEHCPQGVRVADILYELRNEACRRLDPSMVREDNSPFEKSNRSDSYHSDLNRPPRA